MNKSLLKYSALILVSLCAVNLNAMETNKSVMLDIKIGSDGLPYPVLRVVTETQQGTTTVETHVGTGLRTNGQTRQIGSQNVAAEIAETATEELVEQIQQSHNDTPQNQNN